MVIAIVILINLISRDNYIHKFKNIKVLLSKQKKDAVYQVISKR